MSTVEFVEDFDANATAETLREALKGMGTDEDAVIEIISRHPNPQRQEMAEAYTTLYGRDLLEDLKSDLRGDFEQVTIALMTPPSLYDARELRRAMKGVGTDEAALIEIMCSRTNDEIEAIKEAYTAEFGRILENDLRSDTTRKFEGLLTTQCTHSRQDPDPKEYYFDYEKALEEGRIISGAGEAQWGTDEAEIQAILCSRSYPQLKATFIAYAGIAGRDIEEAIESECSGNLQDGYLTIVQYAKSPANFFAQTLHKYMKGIGTDEEGVIRIIVSRSEIDLARIKVAFNVKYERSLVEFVDSECNGDLKKMLVAIINGE